jgi:Fur family zinc uptake transcriptional regulator
MHIVDHDHQGCIHEALDRADDLCRANGVRFTHIRRRVLELIWSSHASVKAYDLLDNLRLTDPSAKPATIYRALDFLLDQGLIHRVESLNAYVGCKHPEHKHDLLLLICTHCHEVDERPAKTLMEAAKEEVFLANFQVRRQLFEIYGLCAHCGPTIQ